MNVSQLKAENRKSVLACLTRARSTPFGGLRATEVAKRTRLCLRTVQTHLRALRDEGTIHNSGGQWFARSF